MELLPNELENIIKDYIIFKPKTKEELKTVVNLWCKDKEKALKKIWPYFKLGYIIN